MTMATALAPPDRLPITPAGLVVVRDGVRFAIAIRRGDPRYYLVERTADGLVARWRFRRWSAACAWRRDLLRA